MISNSHTSKILSMISTFEGCENLEICIIDGFDTKGLISFKKLFYKTALNNLSLNIDTSNVEDTSFMFRDSFCSSSIFDLNLCNFYKILLIFEYK